MAGIETAEIGSTVARVDRTGYWVKPCFCYALPMLGLTSIIALGRIPLECDCCGQYQHEMAMNDRSACSLCGSLCDLSLCD